jgi:methylglutaconyl-CoA hydratase
MSEIVLYEIKNRVAYITLNRAEKRNALNPDLVNALQNYFTQAANDESVKIIVLKANGKVFSAGADLEYLKQLQQFSFEDNLADSKQLAKLFETIYTHPKVIIAQVQGSAIAGGCGLATVCDFTFAVAEAQFGYTEVKIGFIPAIVMVFLLRKIGEIRAKELTLTGKLISAQEAREMGLIHLVVSTTEIEEAVYNFAEELCRNASSESLKRTKQMIAKLSPDLQVSLNYAAQINAEMRSTEDCKKGISAFLNKEQVNW